MKVLVVEDTPEVVETIWLCLTVRWPDVVLVATGSGEEAIDLARSVAPDIVLLDLGLIDLYGLQVLKEIRHYSNVPVIIITANNEEVSRLKSFELGSDDYLVKPFSHIELLGSVKAALSRSSLAGTPSDEGLSSGGQSLMIELQNRRILYGGREIPLTATEWKLLSLLVHNHGQVVPYSKLARSAWETENVNLSTIQTSLRNLASKLGDDPRNQSFIEFVEDEGYTLSLGV